MANLTRRNGELKRTLGQYLAPAAAYTVIAYEVGAEAVSNSGATITVRAGHGFAANDKILKNPGTDNTYSGTIYVSSVTATTLVMSGTFAVASGDVLFNLGADTGTSAPNYQSSGVTIYSDMDGTTAIGYATVTTDSEGEYGYWHATESDIWELVLQGSSPVDVLREAATAMADRDPAIRYAHLFATSGLGTSSDPWVTSGSNPVQAAFDDLPTTAVGGGGVVRLVPGVYALGSDSTGLVITNAGASFAGITLEGVAASDRNSTEDGAVLQYSGSGAAIKVGHFATNTSYWCEGVTLKNFKVVQTGSAGTGIGILARLFRYGTIEDVLVKDFSTGIGLATVSDFNTFRRLRVNSCLTWGVDVGQTTDETGAALPTPNGQCNANRFVDCDFRNSARNNGATAWGLRIHMNAVNTLVERCEFHDYDTSGYGGIIISSDGGDVAQTNINACYFEGNHSAITHNNGHSSSTTDVGLSVTNNYITQIEGYGVRVNSASTGATRGVTISGNTFLNPSTSSPYDTAIGVSLGTYVSGACVNNNVFEVLSPLGYTLPGGNVVSGAGNALEIIDDTLVFRGAYQSKMIFGSASELITLSTSGLTTDSTADLLPANSEILAVTARITTTITTTTNWALGDATTAARFAAANSTKSAGTTSVGLAHRQGSISTDAAGPVQVSAGKLRITCSGSNPGAGAIRVTVFYRQFSAATS